jgi:hypothetical protein
LFNKVESKAKNSELAHEHREHREHDEFSKTLRPVAGVDCFTIAYCYVTLPALY